MRSTRLNTCLFLLAGAIAAGESSSGAEEKAGFPRVWVSTTEIEAVQPKKAPFRESPVLEKGRLRMRRGPKKPKKAQLQQPRQQQPEPPVRPPPGANKRLQQQPDMVVEAVFDLSERKVQDDFIEDQVEPNRRIAHRQQSDMLFVPFPYYTPPEQRVYDEVSLDEFDDDWMMVKKPETAMPKTPIVIARCPQMML